MLSKLDEQAQNELKTAARTVEEILEKFVYAGIALLITILAAILLGVRHEHALEVGLLNAGIAFYSHEATRNVVAAMWNIARVIKTADPENEAK